MPAAFLAALRVVSAADLEADPTWAFAPVGVSSTNFEVDVITLAQMGVCGRVSTCRSCAGGSSLDARNL